MFTPNLNGLQKIGEAQVLSDTVIKLYFFAIFVIFGKSIISKVVVPGDSKKINLVFFLLIFRNYLYFLLDEKNRF